MLRVRGELGLWLVLLSRIATCDVGAAEPGGGRPEREVRVISAAFSPDGKTLASLSSDRTFCLWDVASGKERKKTALALQKGEEPERLSYSPSGEVVVLLYKYEGFAFERGVATQGTISACLWGMASGRRSPYVPIGYGGLGFCPKGRLLAYWTGLWEVATGKMIRKITLPPGLVYDIEVSPDGKTVAYRICESLAQDGALLFLVDVATGKKVLQVGQFDWDRYKFSFASAPKFSPDGKCIAFCEWDAPTIQVWNVAAGKAVRRFPTANYEQMVGFSPNGKTLVSRDSTSGTVRLWEMATGKERWSIKVGHGVGSVTLSPDGKTMAVAKADGIEFRSLWK
jgi:WD40 repeat protein